MTDLESAGVPRVLAEERAARVSRLHYALTLHVPPERDRPISGKMAATFTLTDATASLAFDFAQPSDCLVAVVANGHRLPPSTLEGRIVIPGFALYSGQNRVAFEFTAGDAPLNRQDDFLYSLFVPARASRAVPCLDQPDLKARWQLTLDIPSGWTAVSNAGQAAAVTANGRTRLSFDETVPLPTYLFSFAAGRFTVDRGDRRGRTFHIFHRETNRQRILRNLDGILDLHASAISWLESYSGIPYPFGKFDVVLVPGFQFSGMEHPGAVYYDATTLLLDESATQNGLLARANVISHETAHMWFGNLVTMTWFDDVWMKEVFANFMAAHIVNPSFPEMNHDLRFLVQHYPAAYDVDRTDGTNPIRQPLDNLNDAGSLYGAIIYQKAPIAMRQLEVLIGPETLRDGLREYLGVHRFGNADWPDLLQCLGRRTALDLAKWADAWISHAGRPHISTALDVVDGMVARLAFNESDPRGRGLHWPQAIRVIFATETATREFDVAIDGGEVTVPDAVGLAAPLWVLPVGGGLGYGCFDLDSTTMGYLCEHLDEIADPLTRGSAAIALWEGMQEGRVRPATLMQILLRTLPREQDELNLQLFLDNVSTLFWRFTVDDVRRILADRVEGVLRSGLDRAATSTAKGAWFSALRGVTTSQASLDWLTSVWRGETRIPMLPLAEVDEIALAFQMALRGGPAASEIVAQQEARILNPDLKARFQFIKPAVSDDPAVRAAFFKGLKSSEHRRREAWVVDAMKYLHHPVRAESSQHLLLPALEMLPDVKRTGDIFFPKRWSDAALSGYQSPQIADDVRTFIAALPPEYPERLRWTLLSAADPLFRAARISRASQP